MNNSEIIKKAKEIFVTEFDFSNFINDDTTTIEDEFIIWFATKVSENALQNSFYNIIQHIDVSEANKTSSFSTDNINLDIF